MGRHSSADDAEDDAVRAASAVVSRPRPGRHAHADEGVAGPSAEPTAESTPTVQPTAQPGSTSESAATVESAPTAESVPTAKPARGKGNQATSADLALLRARSDVRARCIAAVVVPFVLYSVVLYLIGSMHVYLIWVWIPLVTAGVLAGSILDIEHRRTSSTPDG